MTKIGLRKWFINRPSRSTCTEYVNWFSLATKSYENHPRFSWTFGGDENRTSRTHEPLEQSYCHEFTSCIYSEIRKIFPVKSWTFWISLSRLEWNRTFKNQVLDKSPRLDVSQNECFRPVQEWICTTGICILFVFLRRTTCIIQKFDILTASLLWPQIVLSHVLGAPHSLCGVGKHYFRFRQLFSRKTVWAVWRNRSRNSKTHFRKPIFVNRTVDEILNTYRGRFQKGGFLVSVEKDK